ncbi:DUF1028 domain-containing protein [Roseovarius nubinhibens]|uniref:DUF1028 domain-containing protein n=1 Tax=Roseovarius nubinhibens (strain ATCC BAA-591 / DSM 15170 / ISM) TaxID=89187 RepID=A3SJH8_ROSNI|nr:DUF1028 domain-containing protein [Roseovarius nubinhibens]EAP77509.1 hypothetical protein ISM_04430 [Roseovarius nubinhibens ISM]
MTFSLAGRDPETGDIGFAVATSSVCVGARVGALAEGVVVLSQARTDPRLHQVGLRAWEQSASAETTLAAMQDAATALHWRQLGVLPAQGTPLHHTGASCLGACGGVTGDHALALGNFLGSDAVLPAMIAGFEAAKGHLSERLMAGMLAGEAAGSERDPLQSASVVVLGAEALKDVDLRIDDSTDPLADLYRLLEAWLPKAPAYRLRALDPDSAPLSSTIEHPDRA